MAKKLHLATKSDYYSIKRIHKPKVWLPYWKALNVGRQMWYDIGLVKTGIKDETHYWVEEEQKDQQTGEVKTVIRQYEYRDNPLHPFFNLHFTQEEVDASIEEGENLLGKTA